MLQKRRIKYTHIFPGGHTEDAVITATAACYLCCYNIQKGNMLYHNKITILVTSLRKLWLREEF